MSLAVNDSCFVVMHTTVKTSAYLMDATM